MKTFRLHCWVVLPVMAALCFITQQPVVANEFAFDVNDVSILWPVPMSQVEAGKLLTAADKSGPDSLWPEEAFQVVIAQAEKTQVTNSAGRTNKIDFGPFKTEFGKASNWKVVGFRVDPSAPGANPSLIKAFGQFPQLRLVVQPVTLGANDKFRVHDVTVHLVFNFVERFDPPTNGATRPIAVPDKVAFGALVGDLKALKLELQSKGVTTSGKLSVHPGLSSNVDGFHERVRSLLLKHATSGRLSAIAFMGIEGSEPWLFFSMRKADAGFILQPHPTLGTNAAQMLTFQGGTAVMPVPAVKNVDDTRGVHTGTLFSREILQALEQPAFADLASLKLKDIPDLIANPEHAHFFSTDCVSCHTESTRRAVLKLQPYESAFRYKRPEGISGVDESLLPTDRWNVRNFGWFPAPGTIAVPTVTMRTANEAAESADFINREYLASDKGANQ